MFRFPFQVPIPDNEAERLFTLRASELLDSDRSDPMFDRFTALAQRLFNVPIVLVSLVDERRQWCDPIHPPACQETTVAPSPVPVLTTTFCPPQKQKRMYTCTQVQIGGGAGSLGNPP